jgi:cytochrome c-type biogenesis protein CcmE
MAEITWEKPVDSSPSTTTTKSGFKIRFLIVGLLLVGAVVLLLVTGTTSGARFFISVQELVESKAKYAGQVVRISGVVIGDTIQYDSRNLIIDFKIANVAADAPDQAKALHEAAFDPNALRIPIHVENQVKPDLLQHEAQAIITGTLREDGVFYATELLLKCPSHYSDTSPNVLGTPGASYEGKEYTK